MNYIEGCEKVGKFFRFHEKIQFNQDSIEKLPVSEKLTEAVNGSDLPVYGAYEIKIWNEGKNLNKRNYHRVIDQVIKENKVTLGFVNHPKEGEEDPARIYSVQKNPKRKNGWLVVEMYLVGDYGKLAESVLRVGGPLCVSSSALGDVDPQTGDVIPGDNFILERYGDWVWGPSNGAYQFLDDIVIASKDQLPENIQIEQDINRIKEQEEEKVTIYKDNNKGEDSMSDKLMETNLTWNIRALLKECESLPTLAEQKILLETALDAAQHLTDKTLYEEISNKIKDNKEQTEKLAEKGKTVDSLQEQIVAKEAEVTSLKEKATKLEEEKVALKQEHDTLIKMYEDKQFEASDTEKKVIEQLNETIKLMKARTSFLKKKIDFLTEKRDYFEALSNTKVDAEYIVKAKQESIELQKKNKLLEKKIKFAKILSEKKEVPEEKVEEKVVEKIEEIAFVSKDVQEYFNRILEKDSSVKDIEKEYAACKTLREAQILRMHTKANKLSEKEEKAEKPAIIVEKKEIAPVKTSLEKLLEQNNLF